MTQETTRAVITGGVGFIGRHLVRRFVEEGCRVAVVDLELASEEAPTGVEHLRFDVAGPEAERAVRLFGPHVVVHAAAQTRVGHSLEDPTGDALTNIIGTLRMLEAARGAGALGFVFLSSAAIYGEPRSLPIREDHPVGPLSPYGQSKLAATRYVEYYSQNRLVPALTLVPANIYGPGQPAGRDGAVVPAFVACAASAKSLRIDGDGTQTRDFVYVEDLVEAVWLTWERLRTAGSEAGEEAAATRSADDQRLFHLNIGSGRETSILDLARLVERVAGRDLGLTYAPYPEGNIRRSVLDASLARRVLGWTPAVSLPCGIERTYRAFTIG